MLPKQLDVVRQLGRPVQIAVSAANADRATMIEQILAERDVAARIVTDTNASLISAADLVLVASGTATLHVAAYRKPMIVMYHAGGRWLAWPHRVAGRLVLKLPRLSLVNILAGRRVVPEFMPFILDSQPIAAMARALLDDVALRERQIAALEAVVGPLESTNASQRACDLLEALVHAGHAPDNGN
jgi:lipid-A-disaccharide synthase